MKTIAVVTADFERTFLGLPSRLTDELHGETVIRRTLKRLRAAKELAGVHLLVRHEQEAVARSAVAGLDVAVETHEAAPPPWIGYVSSARKWSLDGWRGGLVGSTVFDEFTHPWLLDALARREGADAVACVATAAPLIDPALLDALVRHYAKVVGEVRLGIVQTAPGLSAIVYQTEMLTNLANSSLPPGRSMAYRPDDPQNDIIMQPCLCPTDAAISHAWGRCIADTGTSMRRIERLLGELKAEDPIATNIPDALTVSRWLRANLHTPLIALPDEVEIEITTDDPLPESTLRPRGKALGRTSRMQLATFDSIVRELANRDDQRIVLGGFGDPLLHEQFPTFVRAARESGILGITVRTTAVNLDDQAIDALLDAEVDVVNVLIDAADPATYRRVHNADHFNRVAANIDRLCIAQHKRNCPRPLIVPELMKTPETMDDMEAFYDHWVLKVGSAVIAGPSRYAGAWPTRAVVNMAPPTRFTCSRLFHRAMILADGRVALCDQDFQGKHAIGAIDKSSLADLWQSNLLSEVRQKHLAGTYDGLPLCRACEEWHRP